MKTLTANFTNQIKEAIEIGDNCDFTNTTRNINSVLICGLGGSGIGGSIISLLLKSEVNIPVFTTNDYSIPNFVDENTLVIASSYSGNTEETIAAVVEGQKRGAEVVAITSGGKILDLAKANGWNHFVVPGGEQPRGMLAYSLVQLLYIFEKYELVEPKYTTSLSDIVNLIDLTEKEIQEKAMAVAKGIYNKTLVIYSEASLEGVSVRFRQQVNENAKELCWHHVLPEMNHNELVGWAGGSQEFAVVKLNSSFDFYRSKKRWDFCKEIISKKTDSIFEIEAVGETKLGHVLYLIHLTDWVSVFLADIKKVDSVEVDVIIKLKSELSKLN